jgi:hypothetical protein
MIMSVPYQLRVREDCSLPSYVLTIDLIDSANVILVKYCITSGVVVLYYKE